MFGEQHILVGEILNNIGLLLYMQGLYDDAYPMYEQALAIKELAYGNKASLPNGANEVENLHKHNISIATSYHNLAILCHRVGKTQEAKTYYEKAIALREAFLGISHPDTETAKGNLNLLVNHPNGGANFDKDLKVLPDGTTTIIPNNSGKHLFIKEDSSVISGGSFVTLGQESDVIFPV